MTIELAAPVCPRCGNPIAEAPYEINKGECGVCLTPYSVLSGAPRAAAAESPEAALPENAVCFFHEENAAHTACERCGRFVCRLCLIAIEDQKLCPQCFQRGREQATLTTLRSSDFLYDSLALLLGWVWILFYPSWFVIVPVVAYLNIRHRRAPRNYLMPRAGWPRFTLAWLGLTWPFILIAIVAFFVRLSRSAIAAQAHH